MAIGFMPSDEDTDARYERLNRILLELYEVVYHLVNREARPGPAAAPPGAPGPHRVRPSSDSAAPRLPDLLHGTALPGLERRRISSQRSTPASPSCSAQHLSRTFSDLFHQDNPGLTQNPLDDEVFLTAPTTRSIPPRQRRRRKRSTSLKDVKKRNKAKADDPVETWQEGQTRIEDLVRGTTEEVEQDTVDSSASSDVENATESESSLVSTLLSTSLGGSLWTAVVLVVGWRLLAAKR